MEEKDIDEIVIPEDCELKLRRVYNYLPYTHWRIKRILKQRYNAKLIPIGSYKCNRIEGYKQRYRLVDCATGRIIRKEVKLDTLRRIFAKEGIPLHDKKSS